MLFQRPVRPWWLPEKLKPLTPRSRAMNAAATAAHTAKATQSMRAGTLLTVALGASRSRL
jgi:hypothetical protein